MRNLALRTSNSVLVLQRRAEQELLEAKALLEERGAALATTVSLLHATLESAPDGIVAVDRSGRILALNTRFAAIWGLEPDAVRAMPFFELMQVEASLTCDPAGFLRRKAMSLVTPEIETFDVIELIDGRTLERTAVPQRIDGQCVGVVVHWRDVTERRRSEEARLALAEQLRQAQKMESLGALSGGIAHDFNNIIGAILGNAELALVTPDNMPCVTESLTAIREAGDRAARLVQQILMFSRQQPNLMAPLSVAETVQEAVRLLRATIPAGIQLTATLESTTPLVLADATHVHQIVMNLCTNALHALHERPDRAGRAGRIEVRVERTLVGGASGIEAPAHLPPGEFVCLTVSDDGVGMDDATLSRIFEPFFTTRPIGEGTGLGLAVVHGIMEAHHGAITVRSTTGAGSTFTLWFPAITSAARQSRPTPFSSGAIAATSATEQPMRILYVDDDGMIVSLVSRLLRKGGCQVSGFGSAQHALDALRATPAGFDVVVTDFNMPELSGLDIARAARALRADIPVVITSGYITPELQAEADRLGVYQVLYKPDLAKRLLLTLRAIVHPESF